MILHASSSGQGPNGSTPRINGTPVLNRSYDSLLTGIGYGTYNLSFPQWNPDSGTLAAVRIRALVTVQYGFTLKDVDLSPGTYAVLVGREDQIQSSALTTPYDNIVEQKIGTWSINPGSAITQSPFAFMDNYPNTDSITDNIAPFLGTGNVNFTYSPITYSDIHSNNNTSYNYSAHVLDTMHFSVTYFYSSTGIVLAAGLTSFTAALIDPSDVQLAWTADNEPGGRQYEIQASRDGTTFSTIAIPISSAQTAGTPSYPVGSPGSPSSNSNSPASYQFTYALPPDSPGKWYFRLKITDTGGNITWSAIRVVTVDSGLARNNLSLYPNPATDLVNLAFDQPSAGPLEVDVLNAAGALIQRKTYPPALTLQVDLSHIPTAGAYFLRVTELQTRKTFSSALYIVKK